MGLESLKDEALLQRARKGCEPSFTVLYRRHQGRIYRFALQMCGSAQVAEEVTQEVFVALVAELDRYDSTRGSLLPYLMGVARNQVYRWLRREQPFLPLDSGDGEEASLLPAPVNLLRELTERETIHSLRRAIEALPPVYREVVLLCDMEEMDYSQAAQALGCAIGTVRSRLHRARALLTEKWRAERRPAASVKEQG
ncbi:MAG: RNA polymerase sigma factor [Bryobacterales bacterium]|nr:RNA polymerase sigma factor [Bryobacterales bacterium]